MTSSTPSQIILASTSPYRKQLLESMRVQFAVEASLVDEDAYKSRGLPPQELCDQLAYAKASAVHKNHPEALVIGSDQLVQFKGETLGKPKTIQANVEQLQRLQDESHQLITSLCVLYKGQQKTHTDITHLHMRALDKKNIENYVALDQALDCAGGYKLEAAGIALFKKIESQDHTAIVGLPLMALCQIFLDLNLSLPNMSPFNTSSSLEELSND